MTPRYVAWSFRGCVPAVLATWCLLLWAPSDLRAQTPPRTKLFDGQWSLDFFAATRPGGETQRVGMSTLSPLNLLFRAVRSDFRVAEDGKVNWTERTNGQWHSDVVATMDSGQRSIASQTTEPLLKAKGTVDDQRKLTLTLRWSHGSGPFIGGLGTTGGTLTVSADGETLTIKSDDGTVSLPHKYLTTEWTLQPASIEQQEQGPDMIREVTTYKARRQGTLNEWGSGPLPVVERIEVKQIRQLKLVPRG